MGIEREIDTTGCVPGSAMPGASYAAPPRVIVVERVARPRDSLAYAFGITTDFELAGVAEDAREAIRLVVHAAPAIAVLHDDGALDLVAIVRSLRATRPRLRVLLAGSHSNARANLVRAMCDVTMLDGSVDDVVGAARGLLGLRAYAA